MVQIDSKGEEEIKEFEDKGPFREVGMGPIKEVDIRDRGTRQETVSNEIQAIVVDHVVNRGLTMAEVARLVHPNCQFDHENISPPKNVSLQDMHYALPLHLKSITYCNVCKFTTHVIVVPV